MNILFENRLLKKYFTENDDTAAVYDSLMNKQEESATTNGHFRHCSLATATFRAVKGEKATHFIYFKTPSLLETCSKYFNRSDQYKYIIRSVTS